MKASEIKNAFDPNIKRASLTAVKKAQTELKKKRELKNMTAKKNTEPKTVKVADYGGLKEIVELKKQKAIINEYDDTIYKQELLKKKRLEGNIEGRTTRAPASPLEVMLAENPEKVKDMSVEDATKLAMFTNKSGSSIGSEVIQLITALGLNKNNGGNGLSDKILGVLLDKMLNNNGNAQKADSGNDKFVEYMIQQNLQTQKLLMDVLAKQNTPTAPQQDNFAEKFFELFKTKGDMENTFLREKIRSLETQVQPTDTLGETAKVIDFVKGLKGFFGGGSQTPESLKHDVEMKKMEYEDNRLEREESMRGKRMAGIKEMIETTVGSFGKKLSEPIIDAAKIKVEQFTEGLKNPPEERPNYKISKNILKEEIDLGDVEAMEQELAQAEASQKGGKSPRFRVYDKES